MVRATLNRARAPLAHYLRALWNLTPALHEAAAPLIDSPDAPDGALPLRPFLSDLGLHLPAQWADTPAPQAEQLYFAAVAHAAAHLVYGGPAAPVGSFKPLQQVLMGLLEDTRVEQLALRALPGLRRLWLPLHDATPDHGGAVPALLARLARALIDPAHADPHPWIRKARQLVEAGALTEPLRLRAAASLLGHDIGQMRLQFDVRCWVATPAYRDDNAHLWLPEQPPPEQPPAVQAGARSEGARAVTGDAPARLHLDPEAAAEAAPAPTERPDGASAPVAASPAASSCVYREWDDLIGRYREAWVTVIEQPVGASPQVAATPLPPGDARLQRLLRVSPIEPLLRRRGLREGDLLDLDAAIERTIDQRAGRHGRDRGLYARREQRRHDLAVLLLLDLSRSVLQPLSGHPQGVLPLIRAAAGLAAQAIEQAGDRCAIDGFCSDGRQRVNYLQLKAFDEPLDAQVQARLDGLQGACSTRLGAALRHATGRISAERAAHRLVLVLTDGEPHDIDIHDPRYLVADARRAVQEAAAGRVTVCGLHVPGGEAARSGPAIFGSRRHVSVGRLDGVAQALIALYRRIAQ
ncbi:MAG: hypothetical protein ABI574_03045 [Burkholderiales bacterium]